MGERLQKPKTPDVAEEMQSFPLPLSDGPGKCPILWAVAGFDPSSGAGITADLMTFAAHGLFGCSVITALTVQSTVGVFGCEPVRATLVADTLNRLEQDLPFCGLKIGMLGTPEVAHAVGQFLRSTRPGGPNQKRVVVWDPVLRSSSGRPLFPEESLPSLLDHPLPSVDWITPNWAELALLSGTPVDDVASAETAAKTLLRREPGLHIVATGGDQEQPHDLLVSPDGAVTHFRGQRVETTSTHGTGCAFSSALLCALVLGAEPVAAVQQAKAFVEGALRAAPGIGHGRGPMGLLPPLRPC